MDQLINQVASQAGISTDQAQTAINVVMTYIKQQLPAPLASQVDGMLQGGSTTNVSNLGGLADEASKLGFGGFGGNR